MHLADHEEPQGRQQDERGQVQQPGRPAAVAHIAERHDHALILQGLDHVRVIGRDGGVEAGIVVPVLTADFHAGNRDFLDISLVHVRHELREIDVLLFLTAAALLHDLPKQEGRKHDDQPEHHGFDCRIHSELL